MKRIWFVGAGGIIGSITRFVISFLNPLPSVGEIPWGTLLCNWIGCLLIGWFNSLPWLSNRPELKLGLTTGFLGGLTTFSAFSLETMKLLEDSRFVIAAIYVSCSLVGGFLFAWIGTKLPTPAVEEDKS